MTLILVSNRAKVFKVKKIDNFLRKVEKLK